MGLTKKGKLCNLEKNYERWGWLWVVSGYTIGCDTNSFTGRYKSDVLFESKKRHSLDLRTRMCVCIYIYILLIRIIEQTQVWSNSMLEAIEDHLYYRYTFQCPGSCFTIVNPSGYFISSLICTPTTHSIPEPAFWNRDSKSNVAEDIP